MMNKSLFIALVFTLMGCVNYSTNVNILMGDKRFQKYETIKVRGYIRIDYRDINLYHEKKSNDHIDVVFDKNMTFDKPLREERYICVDLTGEYSPYEKGSIRVGNATSKYGVIIAKDMRRCK